MTKNGFDKKILDVLKGGKILSFDQLGGQILFDLGDERNQGNLKPILDDVQELVERKEILRYRILVPSGSTPNCSPYIEAPLDLYCLPRGYVLRENIRKDRLR